MMNDKVSQMIVIASGPRLLIGTAGGRVLACRADDPVDTQVFEGIEGSPIRALGTSADASLVMAADATGRAVVWDRENREVLDTLRGEHPITQCVPIDSHHYLTVDSKRNGQVWMQDADRGLLPTPITDRPNVPCPFDRFGVSSDGARIVLLSGFQWMLWDRQQGVVTETHEPVDGMQLIYMAGDVGLSKDGRFYYVYWDDYMVIDTTNGRTLWTYPVRFHLRSSALSDNGQFLMVGRSDGQVVVVGPDDSTVVDVRPTESAVIQGSLAADGCLATFVDNEGGAGCIEVPSGQLLIDREAMSEMLARIF